MIYFFLMQDQALPVSPPSAQARVNGWAEWIAERWLPAFLVLYGIFVWVPFLAPFFMEAGATAAGHAVYTFYSFFCHQLPERSLFFFGPQVMYSYDQIKAVWPLDGFFGLRQFVGNAAMGYKVAWSDRMISTYGGLWLGGLIYALLGKRAPRVSWQAWVLIGVLPLGIDGVSHMLNDALAGTSGMGFRDTNAWLQALTGSTFPSSFYSGDALGSFNSWARWVTGSLFSVLGALFIFPLLDRSFRDTAEIVSRAAHE